VGLPENKYMFKNIERKQRMIDDKQRGLKKQQERKSERKMVFAEGESVDNKMFNSSFMVKVQENSQNSIEYSNHTSQYVVHANQSKLLLQQSLQHSKDFSKLSGIF